MGLSRVMNDLVIQYTNLKLARAAIEDGEFGDLTNRVINSLNEQMDEMQEQIELFASRLTEY